MQIRIQTHTSLWELEKAETLGLAIETHARNSTTLHFQHEPSCRDRLGRRELISDLDLSLEYTERAWQSWRLEIGLPDYPFYHSITNPYPYILTKR